MKPAKPTPPGRILLNIFLVGFLIGFLWPGGAVGGLFMGLGAAFLACVSFLAWSFLNW